MKTLFILFFFMIITINSNAETYWVDNSRENEAGGDIGTGIEEDPYNKISIVEKLITAGSDHEINIVGSMKPYQGGFGGHALKHWIFKNCKVIKHETKTKKVIFTATRSIPVTALTGEPGAKALDISPYFKQGEYRYVIADGKVTLTRPFKLGVKKDQGISFVEKKARINTSTIPTKKDLESRLTTLSATLDTKVK